MKPAGEWTYFWNPLCLFCQGDRTGWKGTSAIGIFFAHHVLNGEMRLSSCTLTVQDMIEPTHAFYKFTLHSAFTLTRIGLAIDTCSDQFDEDCIAYDKAAASEEERTALLYNVLSVNADTDGLEDDDAIHR